MKIGDKIYCVDETVYSDHITKRKSYVIVDLKEEQFRIKNNNEKLVWIPSSNFTNKRIPSITSIIIDDEITDPNNDFIEVTIELDNGEKCWTTFATSDWLKNKLTNNWDFFVGSGIIFLDKLTKENVDKTIIQLDKENKLNEASNNYE